MELLKIEKKLFLHTWEFFYTVRSIYLPEDFFSSKHLQKLCNKNGIPQNF